MRRITAIALLFVLPLALVGCFETKEDYTLNPDGSGKVVYEITRPLTMGMMSGGDDKADPQQTMRDEVDKLLTDSKGVDVWADVTCKLADGEKMYFKGTAYFKDFNKLKIKSSGMSDDNAPKFTKTEDGVVLRVEKKKKKAGPAKKLTEAEVTAKVAKTKAEFAKSSMMMGMMLNGLRIQQTYRMPGAISNAKVFTKKDANTVSITLEGEKMLKAMTELMKDDKWLRLQVAAGTEKEPPMADLNEKMFGVKGALEVAAKAPLKAQFNYAAEAARARKAYPAMRKRLKLVAAVTVAPMGAGGGIKAVRVGGVRLIRETDEKNGVRPFNWSKGYTLSLIAEFPGAIMKVKEGKILTAIADNGEDLLLEKEWDRRVSFPRLSKNKAVAVLDVKLKVPSAKVKGIKELTGELTFLTSKGSKTMDLGMVSLTAGSKGSALGAQIKSVKESKWQKGRQELELLLQVKNDQIKSVKFYDANRKDLALNKGGSSWSRNQTTIRYNIKGKLPAQAKIVVELYDQLQESKTQFSIKNIDLIGNPR